MTQLQNPCGPAERKAEVVTISVLCFTGAQNGADRKRLAKLLKERLLERHGHVPCRECGGEGDKKTIAPRLENIATKL
jgi:hypothetical protein